MGRVVAVCEVAVKGIKRTAAKEISILQGLDLAITIEATVAGAEPAAFKQPRMKLPTRPVQANIQVAGGDAQSPRGRLHRFLLISLPVSASPVRQKRKKARGPLSGFLRPPPGLERIGCRGLAINRRLCSVVPDGVFALAGGKRWVRIGLLAAGQRRLHEGAGFSDELAEVRGVAEALGVELVEGFGAAGPCGEPAARRLDLEPADGFVIAGRADELALDGFAGQLRRGHGLGGEVLEGGFLLEAARGVAAGVLGFTQLAEEVFAVRSDFDAGPGGDLRSKQARQEAVLLGDPGGPSTARKCDLDPSGLIR